MASRGWFRGFLWTVVALLVVAHVIGGWHYSNRLIDDSFTPDPGLAEVPEGDFELDEVEYRSALGAMDAWHLPANGSTWVIHVHGLNATPAEPAPLFHFLQDAGYPQLAIAYRNDAAQAADPSGYFRYGATEWEDVLGAVEYARENGAGRVVLAGYGAGGSHVLSFVFRHNFDDIGGVILDSPNIDMGTTVDHRVSIERLPVIPANVPVTISWVAKFLTSLRIDVNWRSLDYIDKANRSLRVPVLVYQGTVDDSLPVESALELAESHPDEVTLIQIEGAGHVDSFNTDFPRYAAALLEFLDRTS